MDLFGGLVMAGMAGIAVLRLTVFRVPPLVPVPLGRIKKALRTTLAKAPPGVDLRLIGRFSPSETRDGTPLVQAPISGRMCLAWQVRLYVAGVALEDGPPNWKYRLTEESGNRVQFRDRGGSVDVQLAGALWATAPRTTRLAFELDLTPETRAFLARNDVAWSGYSKPVLRIDERILTSDQTLMLFGRAVGEAVSGEAASPYRAAPTTRIFVASDACPLVLLPSGGVPVQ